MTVIIYKHPPATIQCVSAFTKWYGMSVCDDMDIQTEVAWDHWQHAWHASKLDSDREQAEISTAAQPPADGALNTIAAMFHSGEEIEGPDGLAMMVDMSVWNDALDAFDEISGDDRRPLE